MLEAIRNKKDREQGFTLIELMVVVLIIAILVAIAVPTFLGARSRSQQKAAQSGARNALVSAKVLYTDTATYEGMTQSGLAAVEKDLTFEASDTVDSTGPKSVSWDVTGTGAAAKFYAAVLADDDTCYMIEDEPGASGTGTRYWKTAPDSSAACSGADASALDASFTETGWN